jgi:hypothetical protein
MRNNAEAVCQIIGISRIINYLNPQPSENNGTV